MWWIKAIEYLHRLGCMRISFTGGEPLLRRDLTDILKKCRDLGITTHLNTNGLLATRYPEVFGLINSVKISLDGCRELHNTNRPGCPYDKVVEAVEFLASTGIPLEITSVVTGETVKNTARNIRPVVNIAEKLKASVSFQPIDISLTREGAKISRLRQSEKHRIYMFLARLSSIRHPSLAMPGPVYAVLASQFSEYPCLPQCYAGRFYFSLDADGSIYSCDDIRSRVAGVQPDMNNTASFAGSLARAIRPYCRTCLCNSTILANLALNGNLSAISALVRTSLHLPGE